MVVIGFENNHYKLDLFSSPTAKDMLFFVNKKSLALVTESDDDVLMIARVT